LKPIDPWLYYFDPCFDIENVDLANAPLLPGGVPVACSKNNVITPRLHDGKCNSLLLPKDRTVGYRLINQYINVNDEVQSFIDSFRADYFDGNIIGLHIRGKGRRDGGVSAIRKKLAPESGVPFSLYFNSVNRALEENPDSKIFVCSDSELVIRQVQQEYGDRVICYNSTRSEFGEMHASHPENKGAVFPKYKLGLDVVVEAWLLSDVNYLVHGNSNIVNFVLCKNPELEHAYVYA